VSGRLGRGASSSAAGVMSAWRLPSRRARPTRRVTTFRRRWSAVRWSWGARWPSAFVAASGWLVVPLLVHVRDRRYRLDWESQAAGWFSMIEALSLPLLPGSTRSSPRTATSLTGT